MMDGPECLEGLVSNFFVVQRRPSSPQDVPAAAAGRGPGPIVRTCPVSSRVLPGVVRAAVLRACEELGIEVEERAPSLEESAMWCVFVVLQGLFRTGSERFSSPAYNSPQDRVLSHERGPAGATGGGHPGPRCVRRDYPNGRAAARARGGDGKDQASCGGLQFSLGASAGAGPNPPRTGGVLQRSGCRR